MEVIQRSHLCCGRSEIRHSSHQLIKVWCWPLFLYYIIDTTRDSSGRITGLSRMLTITCRKLLRWQDFEVGTKNSVSSSCVIALVLLPWDPVLQVWLRAFWGECLFRNGPCIASSIFEPWFGSKVFQSYACSNVSPKMHANCTLGGGWDHYHRNLQISWRLPLSGSCCSCCSRYLQVMHMVTLHKRETTPTRLLPMQTWRSEVAKKWLKILPFSWDFFPIVIYNNWIGTLPHRCWRRSSRKRLN
jgi:hypothetical protein